MSAEFTPKVLQIEPEFNNAEQLLKEKTELGLDDKELIGFGQSNYFKAEVDIRFPTPDALSIEFLSGQGKLSSDADAYPEFLEFDTSVAERKLEERLSQIIQESKKYASRLQAAASWMVRSLEQSERINDILGDCGLYYECAEDYLRGVGARFCTFENTAESQKGTTDVVIVSGVHNDNEHQGRLLHIQPLLNIAWILPTEATWSIGNVVPLDMGLDENGRLNVRLEKLATYSQLYRQPDLFDPA